MGDYTDANVGTYADEPTDASIGQKIADSISKTVKSAARLAAPASVKEIQPRTDAGVNAAVGMDSSAKLGSMRAAQSSDLDNSYSYAWLPLTFLALAWIAKSAGFAA